MNEDEYFAREDAEKLRKLHRDQVKHLTQAQKDQLRKQHANRCAQCGMTMRSLPTVHGLGLLHCFECGGTFLDAETGRKLAQHSGKGEHAIVESVLGLLHLDASTRSAS